MRADNGELDSTVRQVFEKLSSTCEVCKNTLKSPIGSALQFQTAIVYLREQLE